MSWKPIIVGIDGSPESAQAAALAARMAWLAGTTCRLVHAAPDHWTAMSAGQPDVDPALVARVTADSAQTLMAAALDHVVPWELIRTMEVVIGRSAPVLAAQAQRHDAAVVVLGGKHHRALSRLGGSTVTDLVRMGTVPVLATGDTTKRINRILVAVDLSYATRPTLDAAERWANLLDAQVRVIHVVEPPPFVPGLGAQPGDDELFRAAERAVEAEIVPLVSHLDAQVTVRRGRAASAITTEAREWRADLVVLGSHGKGWVDRLLIGSTSERLLHVMPAATLVVPVSRPDRPPFAAVGHARETVEAGV